MAKKLQSKRASQSPPKAEEDKIKKTKIRVIGIGGGGGNIVSELSQRVKKASFVVANTDFQALKEVSQKAARFLFGKEFTQGLGTGMNPELGEMAAQKEIENIKKLLTGQDLCVLVASLGGGVGSGAAPVFAKVAKSAGTLTLGVFTLPFQFEGEKRMEIAQNSLRKIKPYLNVISIIPNERVFQVIDKNTPLKNALSAINKMLAESLEGLIETIYAPGLINIDFADVKTVLEGRGKWAYLTTIEVGKKENLIQETTKKLLNNPLYPYGVQGAKGIILNIVGPASLQLSEVGQITKTISTLLNKDAKIILGISQKNGQSEAVKTTILATGCKTKILLKPSVVTSLSKTKKITLSSLPKRRTKKTKKVNPVRKGVLLNSRQANLTRGVVKQKLYYPPRQEAGLSNGVKIKIKTKAPKKIEKKAKTKTEKKEKKPEQQSPTASPQLPEKEKPEEKIRKNALEVKKEIEEAEKEMLAKEEVWETPAFLRKKKLSLQ